jgi:hypothetical protein
MFISMGRVLYCYGKLMALANTQACLLHQIAENDNSPPGNISVSIITGKQNTNKI